MAQFARPDSTIDAAGWSVVDSEPHAHINESTPNDNTRTWTPNNPSATNTLIVSLSNVIDPVSSSNHVIRFRIAQTDADSADGAPSSGGTATVCSIALFQGASQIAILADQAATESAFTQYEYTLSGAEADAITDYTDLQLQFVPTGGAGSPANRRGVSLSWAELEVPDEPAAAILDAYGQAQAQVLQTYLGYAQAQAHISVQTNAYAQSLALVGRPDDLYTYIDEINFSDADYLVWPAGSNLPYEVKLDTSSTPDYLQDYIIRVRAHYFGGAIDLQVDLVENATIRASFTLTLTTTQTTYSYNLTQSEINTIVDYSNLRLRFTPSGGTSVTRVMLEWAELQLPSSTVVASRIRVGRAQALIKQVYNVSAQAQAQILQVYQGYGQSQAQILQTHQVYGQSQAQILAFGINGFAQAQAHILVFNINQVAQAQARIFKQIFYDPFTRTVAGGFGTNDGFTYVRRGGLSDGTAIPSVEGTFGRITGSGVSSTQRRAAFKWERWAIHRGIVQFDFRLPVDSGLNIATSIYIFVQTAGDTLSFEIVDNDPSIVAQIYPARAAVNPAQISPFAYNTWYTAKFFFADISGHTARIKVWETGTQEPNWQEEGSDSPLYSGEKNLTIDAILYNDGEAQTAPLDIDNILILNALDTTEYESYGQAQGHIKTLSSTFAQAQGQILQVYNSFAQAQASILQTYQAYGQAQGQIKQTYNSFAQAQAQIKQAYQEYGQAQLLVTDIYEGFAQTQLIVLATSNVFAQAQLTILTSYQGYGQSQAQINAYGVNAFAQALLNIKGIDLEGVGQAQMKVNAFDVNGYGQSQLTVLTSYQSYGQAQLTILTNYQVYGQAQFRVVVSYSQFAQAEIIVLQTYQSYAQSQLTTLQIYQSYAQAQLSVKAVYNVYAQAQIQVVRAYQAFAQAQLHVVRIEQGYGQAQLSILTTYNGFAQAQLLTVRTEQSYGQAQLNTKATYNAYAQAQINTKQIYQGYAQAQLSVKQVYQGFGQAQIYVYIVNHGYGQAQLLITNGLFGFGQAQLQVNLPGIGFGQAQLDTKQSYNTFAQAQLDVKATYSEYAQVQLLVVRTEQGYGQAELTIKQVYSGFAQAQASIKAISSSYGQANISILATSTTYGQAALGIKATYQGYAQAILLVQNSINAYGQAQISIISAQNVFGQAQLGVLQTYRGAANAQALIVTSVNVSGQAQLSIAAKSAFGQASVFIVVKHKMKKIKLDDRSLRLHLNDRPTSDIRIGDSSRDSILGDRGMSIDLEDFS